MVVKGSIVGVVDDSYVLLSKWVRYHSFQNRTGSGGRTVKTGTGMETGFLSLKNRIFC